MSARVVPRSGRWRRGTRRAGPAATASSRAGDWLAIAMPSAVATVPSMPARPRLACTVMRRPGTARSASRMSREAPNTSRSCGQVAAQTASTSMRRVDGRAHPRELVAQVLALRGEVGHVPGLVDAAAERPSAAAAPPRRRSMRLARTHRPVHARSSADGSCGSTATARSNRSTACPGLYHSMPDGATAIDLDALALHERGHLARERRMPEHDHALDLVAEPGLAQQLAVRDHEVRAEAGAARDLGEERPAARAGELLGARGRRRRPRRRPCGAVRQARDGAVGRGRRRDGSGAPSARRRDGVAPSSSSTADDSGSRNCRFRCTGPGPGCGTASPSASTPSAASTASRARRAAASASPARPSGGGTSRSRRTAPAKMPGCMVVWFERMPRSSAGRSAVARMSGTPAWCASSTAGCRFATAVPDVVTTTAGAPSRPRGRARGTPRPARRCARAAGSRRPARARRPRARAPASAIPARRRRRVTPSRTNALRQRHRADAGLRRELARPGAGHHSVGRRGRLTRRLASGRLPRCRASPGSKPCRRCRAASSGSGRPGAVGRVVGRGVVGVELGELLLEAADALVLLGVGAQAAEELRVVVGGDRAAARRGRRGSARPRPMMNHSRPPMIGTKRMTTIHQPRRRPRMRERSKNAQSATA